MNPFRRRSDIKGGFAALIVVKFKEVLAGTTATPPIIVDIATPGLPNSSSRRPPSGSWTSTDNHTFLSRKMVTRAEMAEILMRLINILKQKGTRFIQQFERIKSRSLTSLPITIFSADYPGHRL